MSTTSEVLVASLSEMSIYPLVDRQRQDRLSPYGSLTQYLACSLPKSLDERFSMICEVVVHADILTLHIDLDVRVKFHCQINETDLNEKIHDSCLASHMQAVTVACGTRTKAPVRLETLQDPDSAEFLGWRIAIVLEDASIAIDDINFLDLQACSTMSLILIHAL